MTPQEALAALTEEPRHSFDLVHNLLQICAKKLPPKPSNAASIAIIGLRGVGKSTLALMALTDLGFAYVDVEKCVSEYTGKPEALFLEEVTVQDYQELQFRLVTAKIRAYRGTSLVVVMPLTIISSPRLMDFVSSGVFKFIINVECETERIYRYTGFKGTKSEALELIRQKADVYRNLGTHDFFNCFSESSDESWNMAKSASGDLKSPFFVLKPVQRDFSRFLHFLLRGPDAAWAYTGNLHLRKGVNEAFSNCLRVGIRDYDEGFDNVDFIGVDYVELDIAMVPFVRDSMDSPALNLCEVFSRLRRATRSAIPIIISVSTTLEEIAAFISEYTPSTAPEQAKSVKTDLSNYLLSLLKAAMRLGPDYLSLDLKFMLENKENSVFGDGLSPQDKLQHFASLAAARGSTQIIGTYRCQNASFWRSHALDILELAHLLQLLIVRVSSVAAQISDNHDITEFRNQIHQKWPLWDLLVSAYNRGSMGKLSRVLNPHLTPVANRPTTADFSASTLNKALSSCGLMASLKFYIFGSNVQTSASPHLYRKAFESMGLPHTIELYECSTLEPDYLALTKKHDFGGAAVLMPFKSEVLRHVDTMSNHVKVIGALNTIIAKRELNKPDHIVAIRGENTDWLGVKNALASNTSPVNSANLQKLAMVLGTGGMARSAVYALIQLGFKKVYLYNRTIQRASELADYYNRLSPLLPSKALTTCEMCASQQDLKYFEVVVVSETELRNGLSGGLSRTSPVSIVSCIPSVERLTGKAVDIVIHPSWFLSPTGGTFLETNYVPLRSRTLENAQKYAHRGWTCVGGFTWLLMQIVAQFEMFTGKQAPVELLREAAG